MSEIPGIAPALADPEMTVVFDRGRLASYLAAVGLRYDPEEPVRQFAGGLANRNYLLTVDDRAVVLRRPPDGDLPPGAHDMKRENFILSRLSKALPFVPDSLHFCSDRSILGVPFQLIEYRAGVVVRGADAENIVTAPEDRALVSDMLVETLAEIHAVDPRSVGLDELGRPEAFLDRAIAGWTTRGVGAAGENGPVSLIGDVSAWLSRQHFVAREPRFLHCDFKLDNLLLDPSDLRPVAVVDWDMGTRGDPMFDLATMLSYWAEPGDPDCLRLLRQMPTTKPGYATRADAVRRYTALTGLRCDDLPALYVLCLFKLGVVFLQLHGQWLSGAVTDPKYMAFRSVGEGLLELSHELLRDPGRLLQ